MSSLNGSGETAVEREMKKRCSSADTLNSGYISIAKLQDIMQQMGEDVSEADVEEMVDEAGCKHGRDEVEYEKFITAFHQALDDGQGDE